MTVLDAISPIDGRYYNATKELSGFFSEKALIKYRILVEIEYLILFNLQEINGFTLFKEEEIIKLRSIYQNFTEIDALKIKEIEKTTNHDVKAVEYFIKEKIEELNLDIHKEFVHFGLTSQDINNTAIPLSLKEATVEVLLPEFENLLNVLKQYVEDWKNISLLARTHGQPASPTRLGKEIEVYVVRLENQIETLKNVPFAAKFGGATGNFNAHFVAFPEKDWRKFGEIFVEKTLGLHYSFPTTQIEHYDYLAAYCDALKRINTIIIDLNRDFWTYISMDYFKQKLKAGEIGSSAMPHKVNPIDFENSEGNLGISSALLEHFAAKLPISRLQRDLTDSTVLRNLGVPIAHTLISIKSSIKGLNKLLLNESKINADLENNWAVVAEAIQTVLRANFYPNPYEALKELTRTNEAITKESIFAFIENLDVSNDLKDRLKEINPHNYTGI